MNFELLTLIALGSAYLSLLFGIAYITERGWIPQRIVRHPVVYVLSLGVFASIWAYYGVVGSAQREGYGISQTLSVSLWPLCSRLCCCGRYSNSPEPIS